MFGKKLQKVASVSGVLQGAATQDVLERAGIPATLGHSKTSSYLDVLVPRPLASAARQLLFPIHRAGNHRTTSI